MGQEIWGMAYEFTDKEVTAWGGMRLMQEMLSRLKFEGALREAGFEEPGSNRGYAVEDVISSFLISIWTGGARFSHAALLRYDEALKKIWGLKQVPSTATFTRFFNRINQSQSTQTWENLNRWFWSHLGGRTVTLDLDSSVITRYGEQEGSKMGYNPTKRGRPSHHPLFAFVSELRMVLHAWMRPGNVASASQAEAFLEESLSMLGSQHAVGLLRADSGFFGNTFLSKVEERHIDYIISAKMTSTLRFEIGSVQTWSTIKKGICVGEFHAQLYTWTTARRFVVIRQELKENPKARGRKLFDCPGYTYQVYVTSLKLPPLEVWRLYRGRADAENRISELKADFGINGFCVGSFWGTETAFRLALLAYNLMALFRQVILQAPKAFRLSTLRFQCFAMGAWVAKKNRHLVLRISLPPPRRSWFDGLFSNFDTFKEPWNLIPTAT